MRGIVFGNDLAPLDLEIEVTSRRNNTTKRRKEQQEVQANQGPLMQSYPTRAMDRRL